MSGSPVDGEDKDVVLIGLGGAGIKTILALRALVENVGLSAQGSRENSCRLLAIDSYNKTQEYFREVEEEDLEGIHLSQKEYLVLLHHGENPWDRVNNDAKSNISEAARLLTRRVFQLGMAAPVRSDYEAMIYVSRERMKQAILDFLKNSEESKKHSVGPIKLVIATSLIGDAGSLSYLALLAILNELSEEIRCESINAVLFGPEFFAGFFPPTTLHAAKYLGVVDSISNFCFEEGQKRIIPKQYLISLYPGVSVHQLSRFEIFTEIAKKVHGLIHKEQVFENTVEGGGVDPMIEMVPLNLEKCLEIKSSFADRLSSDRRFSDLVREFSN